MEVEDISKGVSLIERLTFGKMFNAFISITLMIFLYAIWENRIVAFTLISASPMLQVVIAVMVVLIGVGAGLSGIVKYIDATRDALYNTLRDQIQDLRHELANVEARERECYATRLVESQQRAMDKVQLTDLITQLNSKGLLDR